MSFYTFSREGDSCLPRTFWELKVSVLGNLNPKINSSNTDMIHYVYEFIAHYSNPEFVASMVTSAEFCWCCVY